VTQPPTPIWRVSRESSNVFIGPLSLTVTANGDPVDGAGVKFAVLPVDQRPDSADWTDPVDNPDGTGIGVTVPAVTQPGIYGWWVQITAADAVEVLEPAAVAWIARS